jgi:hypothetical protein
MESEVAENLKCTVTDPGYTIHLLQFSEIRQGTVHSDIRNFTGLDLDKKEGEGNTNISDADFVINNWRQNRLPLPNLIDIRLVVS